MSNLFVDFRKANTLSHLAKMLSVPEHLLQAKLNNDIPQKTTRHFYDVHNKLLEFMQQKGYPIHIINILKNRDKVFNKIAIPKKNRNRIKESRIVWEIIDTSYQELYKTIAWKLETFFENICTDYPHPAIYGYIKGKNILENAWRHCRSKQVLHADIKNFFLTISKERINVTLQAFGINPIIANILANILTIEGSLALGLHTSPLMSNIVCIDLDKDLSSIATKYNCQYTRYADDITISGNFVPTKKEIEEILSKHGFCLNVNKFRITKPGWHHFVTGLSIETDIPRIPKHVRKKLRQELYYCKKYGVVSHIERIELAKEQNYIQRNINRIDGTIKYISYFDKLTDNSYFDDEWNAIKKEQGIAPHYINQTRDYISLFIDETEIEINDSKYLAISLVSIPQGNVISVCDKLNNILDSYINDPFRAIDKEALHKKGLHFNDATEDLRSDYAELLKNENIKVYIGYKKLANYHAYEDTYCTIIENMLKDRMLNTKDGIRGVFIEKNDKISQKRINELFGKLGIIFADKSCIALSLPDFILGYFRNYVLKPTNERKVLFFEKLRAKYKVIKNIDNFSTFTRRRPFSSSMFLD